MVSSSSRNRLSDMFSNMASILLMTSRVSGRRAEAIEDEIDSYEQIVITQIFTLLRHSMKGGKSHILVNSSSELGYVKFASWLVAKACNYPLAKGKVLLLQRFKIDNLYSERLGPKRLDP